MSGPGPDDSETFESPRRLGPAMHRLLFAAGLAMLVLAVPTAAQDGEPLCIITITPAGDWRSIEVVVDLELTEAEMANLTREVDADHDGTITAAETQAYGVTSRKALNATEAAERRIILDGNPSDLSVNRTLHGFEGPAEPRPGMKVQELRYYVTQPYPRDPWHHLQGGREAREYGRAVPETVVFVAPSGWLVWSVGDSSVKAPEATFQGFDTKGLWQARFTQQGYDPDNPPRPWLPVPGAPTALVAVALGAAVLLARRRC